MNSDQRIKLMIGELMVQNALLSVQVEQIPELQKRIAELEAKPADPPIER